MPSTTPGWPDKCLTMAANDAIIRNGARLALLATCVLGLQGCDNASADSGRRMAAQFQQAWADSARLRATLPQVEAALDSAESRADFAQAFADAAAGTGNDTLRLAAMAVVMDASEFAREAAHNVVQPLLDGHSSAAKASRQLRTMGSALAAVGKERYGHGVATAVQQLTDGMDLADQMRVYAAASTPGLLGAAMARERMATHADTAELGRRVAELRKIYSPAQMREFEQNYYINK